MAAEMLLVQIIRRAKALFKANTPAQAATEALNFFLTHPDDMSIKTHLDLFCNMDDYDVMCTIKNWSHHADKILSTLSRCLVDRKLFKIELREEPCDERIVAEKKKAVARMLQIDEAETHYFVFTGEASNITYNTADEK